MKAIFSIILLLILGVTPDLRALEMRGIWVRPPHDPREIQTILDTVAHAGMNAIFLETYYHSYTIFPSVYAKQRPEFAGRDVLQEFIDAAKSRDIEVHAWFQVFYAGNPKHLREVAPVLRANPEWILPAIDGTVEFEDGKLFLNPALPPVRSYLLSVMREIVRNYDIHGLHLDYIRYPVDRDGRPPGYDEYSRLMFKRQYGIDPLYIDRENDHEQWLLWTAWRKRQVTTFVEEVRRMLLYEKPGIKLSAAVFSEQTTNPLGDEKCQDWDTWAAEGLIDFLTPMCYAVATERVIEMVRESIKRSGNRVPVYIGLALNHHTDTESFHELISRTMAEKPDGLVIFAWNWRQPFTFEYLRRLFEEKLQKTPS